MHMWIGRLPAQSLGSNLVDIDLCPQGSDGGALTICPLDHVDGVKFFLIFFWWEKRDNLWSQTFRKELPLPGFY